MIDRNVNLYDLENAQQILAALLPKQRGAVSAEKAQQVNDYVPFSSRMLPQPQKSSPTPFDPFELEIPPDESLIAPTKFTAWEDCIAWCMRLMRAEAVFVVDSQGFVIASRGRIPAHGFECTGAELVCSVDQLERIDPEAGKILWVDLDYEKQHLIGFMTPVNDAEYFIVGIVSPDSSYQGKKNMVSQQILASLSDMR